MQLTERLVLHGNLVDALAPEGDSRQSLRNFAMKLHIGLNGIQTVHGSVAIVKEQKGLIQEQAVRRAFGEQLLELLNLEITPRLISRIDVIEHDVARSRLVAANIPSRPLALQVPSLGLPAEWIANDMIFKFRKPGVIRHDANVIGEVHHVKSALPRFPSELNSVRVWQPVWDRLLFFVVLVEG